MSNPNMTPEEAWHEIVNLFYDLSMPCPDGVSMIDHVTANIAAWRLRDLMEDRERNTSTHN